MFISEKINNLIHKFLKHKMRLAVTLSRNDESLTRTVDIQYDQAESIEFGQSFIAIYVSYPDKDGISTLGIAMTEFTNNETRIIARASTRMHQHDRSKLALKDEAKDITTYMDISCE